MHNTNTPIEFSGSMTQKVFFDSVGIAKAKYEAKSTIIKEANDLSVQDKLEAFDVASAQYYLDVFVCLCITGTVIFLLKKAG